MLFTQAEFLVFAAVVLGLLAIVQSHRLRKLLLLLASYYFYAYWDWRFLSLVIASSLVDFTIGKRLAATLDPRRRRWLVAVSLTFNLGVLAVYKYLDFFIDSLAPLVSPLGIELRTLGLLLPIGISFYTFQTLSYTLDIYARKLEPTESLLDFATYVAFFPQLVAGPIVRAVDFLPQLLRWPRRTWMDAFFGFRCFTVGLFKKLVLADNLALFADDVFHNAGAYDCVTTWLAVLSYSLQIYFDFSGYSDMAIGVARVMGFRLNENFDFPYLARSMSDFWRRWHISLSTWLRDYLYISLGGNRGGRARTARNLAITMLLGGLWHGAAWTFVAWGLLHALALAGQRMASPWLRRLHARNPWVAASIGRLATLAVVVNGWVLFRAASFEAAMAMLRQMYAPAPGIGWLFPFALFVLPATILIHVLWLKPWGRWLELPHDRWYTPIVLFTMLGCVLVFHPENYNPFLYFQF